MNPVLGTLNEDGQTQFVRRDIRILQTKVNRTKVVSGSGNVTRPRWGWQKETKRTETDERRKDLSQKKGVSERVKRWREKVNAENTKHEVKSVMRDHRWPTEKITLLDRYCFMVTTEHTHRHTYYILRWPLHALAQLICI